MFVVDPAGQYVPDKQEIQVYGVLQYVPAGHTCGVVVLSGQYVPVCEHGIFDVGDEQ